MKNEQPSGAKRESGLYTCIKNYRMRSGEIAFQKGKEYYFDENMETDSELFPNGMSVEMNFDKYFVDATSDAWDCQSSLQYQHKPKKQFIKKNYGQ